MSLFFDPKDVVQNEYMLIRSTNDPEDPCWFNLPKIEDTLWLAKVDKITPKEGSATEYILFGKFFYNTSRDLTKSLEMRNYIETIDFVGSDIVGVFEPDDDFNLTKHNINEVIRFMKQQNIE
jgi:hypothetical protein